MCLTAAIEFAEHKFKKILEEFFITIYDEKKFYSHGIDHHRRVWTYAKELLQILNGNNPPEYPDLTSKLIIACYLHDTGMSIDTGVNHGRYSMDICIKFLNENNLQENEYQDVLEAIKDHDRKDYLQGNANVLLSILSVADDLDAFGFIGIYRYSEIYLTRGIHPSETGLLIKQNAARRFDNFLKTFGFSDELIRKHEKRYLILDSFFTEYNKQARSYQFGEHDPAGCCGIIEMFFCIVNGKTTLKDTCKAAAEYPDDQVIRWFFSGLVSELSCSE